MILFCYLYISNDEIFVKCFSFLFCNVYFANFVISTLKNIISFIICNVLFAKIIKTLNFCTLHVMCAKTKMHTISDVCKNCNRRNKIAHTPPSVQK